MAKLAFLGLGIMGYPMARNLCRTGHTLRVWSHTGSKAGRLAEEEGATACSSPGEAAEDAECIFLCVGDTAMSQEVILGPGGVAETAKAGTVVVDASTVSPEASRRMAAALASRGVEMLDAPCTGSRAGAEGASLTFMVGGKAGTLEKVRPYLEAMGKQIYYCGGAGMGLQAKLSQNLILANLMQAFNEGLVLSTKAGVSPKLMLEILNNSAARSGLIAVKAPAVFARNFETNFSLRWMHKDVGLALDSANQMQVPVPLTAVTLQMLQAGLAQGLGEDDFCCSIKVLERIAGVEVEEK